MADERASRIFADLSRASIASRDPLATAVVTDTSPLTVRVAGALLSAKSAVTQWQHRVGETVVVSLGSPCRIISVITARAESGTASTVVAGADTITVTTTDGSFDMPFVGTAPEVGDTVRVWWGADGPLAAKIGTVPTPPPPPPPPDDDDDDTEPPPPPPPVPETGTITGIAQRVQSSRAGQWRTDGSAATAAYQGHNPGFNPNDNTGWYFYGSQFKKSGCTCTKITLTMRRSRDSGVFAARTVHVRLHTYKTRPSSPGSVLSTGDSFDLAAGAKGTFMLDDSLGQKLLDGDAYGIALYYVGGTDYLACYGVTGKYAMADAGKITIDWRANA